MNDPKDDDLPPEHVEIDAYLRDSRRKLTERLADERSLDGGLTAILHSDSSASEQNPVREWADQPIAVMLISLRIRARASARDLDLPHSRGLDLTLDFTPALVSALARARDIALDLDRARDIAHDLDRARPRAYDLTVSPRASDLASALASARELASDIAHDLDQVPVDASGVDLSSIDLRDLDALQGVTWTIQTRWPAGIAGKVRANSVPIGEGRYEVRPGGATKHSSTARV